MLVEPHIPTQKGLTSTDPADLQEQLRRIVRADEHLMELLLTARALDLPQHRVVAGCIYQTVWNVLTGRPRGSGINDYDLIYFDPADLSKESEAAIEALVGSRLAGFPAPIEVRNQARVHLWFEDYFGMAYSALSDADESLRRYASATHAVGVRLTDDDRLDIFAPFGLSDIFGMIIRPNYALPNRVTHERKAIRAKSVWPELTIVPWDEGSTVRLG